MISQSGRTALGYTEIKDGSCSPDDEGKKEKHGGWQAGGDIQSRRNRSAGLCAPQFPGTSPKIETPIPHLSALTLSLCLRTSFDTIVQESTRRASRTIPVSQQHRVLLISSSIIFASKLYPHDGLRKVLRLSTAWTLAFVERESSGSE
ncbi:hypothetical protein EVG20_g9530 [Dentipellis fragilis]|uniref:Uncharacterized protein n=1 Tax=Dentipellis fragilis TaxID=205917 RepID=A0A4Y9XXN4_9AGAM|nr:hypothetical protein EVG20_g9530 [Dentipellis fragilis]